ncbi:MAG: glycosyltransferase family 2 protein [Candidatus Atribacteria bacterium]|nr:glycosyltransferase family 2 protein [Candidatus Atribacteria bacterium]
MQFLLFDSWFKSSIGVFIAYVFIYWAYQMCIALRGMWNPLPLKRAREYRRFVILIPAHNEEKVIGHLLDSLDEQTYPRGYFDVFVSCDNCVDGTVQMVEKHHARALTRNDSKHGGKTWNIRWAMKQIPLEKYDAVVMFDADNLAEKSFLSHMNDYLEEHPEAEAVQGYLDTKNPDDSWVSRSYALSYWYSNRFWQLARSNWGLSSAAGGTGLVIRTTCLQRVGWDLQSLTDDLEFSTRIILDGGRVHWNDWAVVYDEKPLSFWASRRQRTRWMQGHYWVLVKYGPQLFLKFLKTGKLQYLDWLLYLLSAVTTVVGFGVLAVRLGLGSSWSTGVPLWGVWLASGLIQCAFNIILGPSFHWRKLTFRYIPDMFTYFIYGLTWPPIMLYAAFLSRNQEQWVKTDHTRGLDLSDIKPQQKGVLDSL